MRRLKIRGDVDAGANEGVEHRVLHGVMVHDMVPVAHPPVLCSAGGAGASADASGAVFGKKTVGWRATAVELARDFDWRHVVTQPLLDGEISGAARGVRAIWERRGRVSVVHRGVTAACGNPRRCRDGFTALTRPPTVATVGREKLRGERAVKRDGTGQLGWRAP